MGVIYGIKYNLSRKSTENLSPYILAQAAVCYIASAWVLTGGGAFGLLAIRDGAVCFGAECEECCCPAFLLCLLIILLADLRACCLAFGRLRLRLRTLAEGSGSSASASSKAPNAESSITSRSVTTAYPGSLLRSAPPHATSRKDSLSLYAILPLISDIVVRS